MYIKYINREFGPEKKLVFYTVTKDDSNPSAETLIFGVQSYILLCKNMKG